MIYILQVTTLQNMTIFDVYRDHKTYRDFVKDEAKIKVNTFLRSAKIVE